jgi:hypothetical protein
MSSVRCLRWVAVPQKQLLSLASLIRKRRGMSPWLYTLPHDGRGPSRAVAGIERLRVAVEPAWGWAPHGSRRTNVIFLAGSVESGTAPWTVLLSLQPTLWLLGRVVGWQGWETRGVEVGRRLGTAT